MKRIVLWAAVVGLAAAAWGADVAVERAPPSVGVHLWPAYDGELELKWDSGTPAWWIAWSSGLGQWLGNDFDVSTIRKYDGIKTIRVMTRLDWPNEAWDGFRVGVYAFNRVPGSLMWPTAGKGYFFKPKGETGWKDVPVNWTLPRGVTAFLAAWEQFYDYPNFDPYGIDDNPTFRRHTWEYWRDQWELFEHGSAYPYQNLMLRVVVSDDVAVAPTSLGRVKALYK
jgi:hypothetical protein